MQIELAGTPVAENLFSTEKTLNGIQNLLNHYQKYGVDARLIGSLGRQASTNKAEPILFNSYTNKPSDIDILLLNTDKNTPEIINNAQQIAKHHALSSFFPQIKGKSHIKYRDILLEIEPEILRLKTGSLAGRPISTFDPNLLFHLSALFLSMRPSDKFNLMRHARDMKKTEDVLPEELFKPFHAIMDLKRKYFLDIAVGEIQHFYLTRLPIPVRSVFNPLLREAKKIYTGIR